MSTASCGHSVTLPIWVDARADAAPLELYNFSSLGRTIDLRQLLRARPRQVVVGGTSSGQCRPAALLQIIALFPVQRNLLQGCQIRFRIAVLQEFLYADRRERRDDGGICPLSRKFVGGAASHPAAPRKPDDHRSDGADSYSLEETSSRLALQNGRNLHGFWPFDARDMRRTWRVQQRTRADGTRTRLFLNEYCAYRRRRRCPK
jgi:hypothetical protein